MSALVDRITEVVERELVQWSPTTPSHQHHLAAHVAERVAAELQLTEERHWVSNRHGVLHHAIVGWTAVEETP